MFSKQSLNLLNKAKILESRYLAVGNLKIQCLTASLNPHSKTGTANILQGLSKKC